MDIKINNLGGTICYSFSLKIEDIEFKNLSIKCENYSGGIMGSWVDYDDRLEDLEDFENIEQQILAYFEDKFKKQFNNKNFKI